MIDVERTTLAPASLARQKGWAGGDVLESLHRDFYGKCYLCERELSLGEVEVDHRRLQCHWPEDAHCWTNLFPACGHCNKRRSRAKVSILRPGEGIERRVLQRVRFLPHAREIECMFVAADRDDAMARATAAELERLHSPDQARTRRARYATLELLATIRERYLQEVQPVELELLHVRKRRKPKNVAAEAKLTALLSRRAPFTMLTRALVHPVLADLFD